MTQLSQAIDTAFAPLTRYLLNSNRPTSPLTIGEHIQFNYAGKPRSGKVEKVGGNYLTLDNGNAANPRFQSFTFLKMMNIVRCNRCSQRASNY